MNREDYDDGLDYVDVKYECPKCEHTEWHTEHAGKQID